MISKLIFIVLASVLIDLGAEAHNHFFTGAVYEHARYYSKNESASHIVETNLDCYRKATEIASSKGADVIVFPEYGIFPPLERAEVKKFMETIPDPKNARVNPCEESDVYSQRIILHTLSCMAKNNNIVVVANMGDLQKCEGEPDCPEDGDFHFNANVAFDRDGTLLMKYHKEHLFYEFGMDLARAQQNATFETDFGTFATYICFDIDFGRMSEVGQWPTVDAVLFSTMFVDQAPQMMSIQFWESWALANNKTLLAANIQIPGFLAVGSGIFHGQEGALSYTFNPDGISKLVVARIPKSDFESVAPYASITAMKDDETWEWKGDGKDVPEVCSRTLLNDSTVVTRDYRCMEENMTDYTFVKLTAPKGRVDACNNGVCCFVDYETDGMTEDYYLGVFNGTYNHFGRYNWCEEDCVMARCDPLGDRPCATFPMKSETVFRHLHLKGNFTSKVIYPSVTESGMRLVPRSDWHHHTHENLLSDIHFDSKSGRKLLVAGLKGRCYDKDPPYRR
ncbi:biotinidase-like [Argiope bruennichi]|uniref:Biotinidase like protein n=1 Tax=Argiope bruennichi TaxID=94029 RepID=A0A8T0EXZ4_ARGBR|nr:biotinidase-like [Argiope bruennichi]KAF8782437.1 Biotinidase like protein [Argiope bruennichi]